jgi:hypothetical protein
MPKVYITQDTGRVNFVPATRFGDLEMLANTDVPIYGDTESFITRIKRKLTQFQPDEDFLVLVGDPVLIGVVVAVLANRFTKFTILKWDRQEFLYVPVTLNFGTNRPHGALTREENNNG